MKKANIAVVGATGAVGTTMLRVLEEQAIDCNEVFALASAGSAGTTVPFAGGALRVENLDDFDFSPVDIALFSAGGKVSLKHAPRAAQAKAVVIDNTSAFRMDQDVPLVVPEVNPQAAMKRPRGIIANPNCSTIQMVLALSPLHAEVGIKRIVVSTYQAVSGAGNRAMEELETSAKEQLSGSAPTKREIFPHPIGFNCIPQIDVFLSDGYTKEEHKMMNETRKIFADDNIRVSATCVRVPVMTGHAESVNVETSHPVSPDRFREMLEGTPGIRVIDDPETLSYPLQLDCADKDEVFVGRIRKDPSNEHCLDMWVVSDNLRKGAATNAVQIARLVLEN